MNTDLATLVDRIRKFNDDRDWSQFHNPKDVTISLVLEAAEVLEHFQWKAIDEVQTYVETHKEKVGEEIADVLIFLLLLSDKLRIDPVEAAFAKLAKNELKYPVEKATGTHKKYTEL